MLDDSFSNTSPCPCTKNITYQACCSAYHLGKPAENALLLMRSRYSAYSLGKVEYIIRTQDPCISKKQGACLQAVSASILRFCEDTQFVGLDIHGFIEKDSEAFVEFTARLLQNKQDVSFREKSRFIRTEKGAWLYVEGQTSRV